MIKCTYKKLIKRMIVAEYISHIRESDKKEQTVSEHSNNVAKIASEFGQAV